MKFVIANWKMNLSVNESMALAETYLKFFKETPAEIVVCPSFTSLPFVGKILNDSQISTGGQDVFWERQGAYTGEISTRDLVDLGAGYVILGHSERRFNGEEDWMINRKVIAALSEEPLCPIICVGETEEDQKEDRREAVIAKQMEEALDGVSLALDRNIIIAYEPVWAIGSGITPSLDDIEYTHQMIRILLRKQLGSRSDKACAVVYGGSVNEKTARKIADLECVDGFLVGGASLEAKEFYRIAQTVLE